MTASWPTPSAAFWVAKQGGVVIGSVMASYDGHRGSSAISPFTLIIRAPGSVVG